MELPLKHILFIGGGNIGSAVKSLLKKGSEILVVDNNEAKSDFVGTREEAFKKAEVIFVCVPSRGLLKALQDITEFGNQSAKVIVLTKGMMEGSKFMHEFLAEHLRNDFYLLYGPMIAREILEGKSTGAVLAGSGEHLDSLALIFDEDKFILETSEDIVGVSILGVLKNVYTILLSVIECFELGDNYYGALFSKAVREAGVVVAHFGGERDTIDGFAGLGDLIATSRSPHSSNRTFAVEMVRHGVCAVSAEGWKALPHLLKRLEEAQKKLPVLQAVERVSSKSEFEREVRLLIGQAKLS